MPPDPVTPTAPSSPPDVAARVAELLISHLGTEASRLTGEGAAALKIVGDLGADSLDVVELVMAFEDAFEVEISDDEAERTETVGDAVRLIEGKLAARERAA